jgi:glutamate carboxypeptidase|eukprot:COSAG01_NODE_2847_length_6983_cov_7.853574_5_plen_122_part_00
MRIAQVVARKGRCVWRLCATGIEGHAGNAHATSRNAVVELARAVLDTSQLTDYSEDVTVNVGTFSGGIGVNTVPGSAEALVEMRAADGDVFERTARRIDELMAVSSALPCAASSFGVGCVV